MKTVRLSSQLTWDIRNNAEKKFDNANPSKDYPKDGFDVLKSEKILDKIQKTETMFKEIWSMAMPTETIDELQIKATFQEEDQDDDGEGNYYADTLRYTLPIPDTQVPSFLAEYRRLRVEVPPTHPTIVKCKAVEDYNATLNDKRRDYISKLTDVMDRFSTLNQLMKAAPYIKDLVPQDKLTKMYEKDDRTARRKELAEVADHELKELPETLLEDSLLGDDNE